MSTGDSKCIYCDRTNQQVPLISLVYQEAAYWICPEHLPIMIHKPQQLVGKLPGFTRSEPYIQNHDE